eukprot:CAMPEP_0115885562 /NCGR_PEP_ID=MMETSP0287-20121206/30742_1 /TAXON_ID=412157 /ORGANISM="Chrysochromulina rotalis, Strain UIO044" /LENGTH=69 /DNA_ID=CAMNT_0003341991 /DNA_START=318 /DNA_END=524 /DNA_ORIENTATION=-
MAIASGSAPKIEPATSDVSATTAATPLSGTMLVCDRNAAAHLRHASERHVGTAGAYDRRVRHGNPEPLH